MKPKTMILAVVAVGCGLVASYMTSRLIAERNTAQEVEPHEKVLVARTKIPAHTLFKEADLQKYFVEKELPASAIPKKAIRSTNDLRDKRNSRPMAEDSFITSDDLVDAKTDGLAATLPPGMRAVAIRVNAETLAGGFVLPGSKVDILATLRGDGGSRTVTILQDMLVLAVETKSTRSSEDAQSMLGNTVTLAVWPEEAQALTNAAACGELRLSLRGVGDNDKKRIKPISTGDLARPQQNDDGGPGGPAESTAYTGGATIPTLPPAPRDPTTAEPSRPERAGNPDKIETPAKPEPEQRFHVMRIKDGGAQDRIERFPLDGDKDSGKP